MRFVICFTVFLLMFSGNTWGQTENVFSSAGSWGDMLADEGMQTMRRRLKSSGNQTVARNLLIVQAVADYKSGDEKYAADFADLENNREYQEKLRKIMDKLSNKKRSNSQNRAVINILNEAGNKIYNLLAN